MVLLKEKTVEQVAKKQRDAVVQSQPGQDKYPKSDKANALNSRTEILRAVRRILRQWKKVRRSHLRAAIRIPRRALSKPGAAQLWLASLKAKEEGEKKKNKRNTMK